MNHTYFDSKDIDPTEQALKKALGELYSAYKEILELAGSFDHEWKYYGAKIGWQIKAANKGKALFWLAPLEGSFRLAFSVRQREREQLLKSNISPASKEQLATAKKYLEGYPLRFTVTKKSDMKDVRIVLETLKELRT